MNNNILLLFPIINVIVTGLFAGVVLRQYLRRHRVYQLFWAIALFMAFFATLTYVVMILVHPASDIGVLFFRIYYILGVDFCLAWPRQHCAGGKRSDNTHLSGRTVGAERAGCIPHRFHQR